MSLIEEYVGKHSPSYIVEIYHNGEVLEKIYGTISKESNVKVNSNTLYDIASLTKTFTSVLTYIAIQEGKLKLEDTIYEIDHNFANLKQITILDLLAHRQEIWTKKHLKESKNKQDFYKILYSAYIYQKAPKYVDVHYIILGTLLEKVYHISYKELVYQKIKDKLNLQSLTFNPETDNIAQTNYEKLANGEIQDGIEKGMPHDSKANIARRYGIYTSHAGIFINGKDLLKFLTSILNCGIVEKQTLNSMLTYDIEQKNGENLYNYMGARHRSETIENTEIPNTIGKNAIYFSGYTGPAYLIDFDCKIIILVMCNVTNHNIYDRKERKRITNEIVKEELNSIY